MDLVDITLREWRCTPFEWGMADCMLSMGRYIAAAGGIDLTAEFIGSYDDQDGAMEALRSAGGCEALFDLTGWQRVSGEPQRGDAVVMTSSDPEMPGIGALCTGDMIASRLDRGVIEVAARFVHIGGVWRGSR